MQVKGSNSLRPTQNDSTPWANQSVGQKPIKERMAQLEQQLISMLNGGDKQTESKKDTQSQGDIDKQLESAKSQYDKLCKESEAPIQSNGIKLIQ